VQILNKITHLKKSLKQTITDKNLETVEIMLKKLGKLLMELFLPKPKKAK